MNRPVHPPDQHGTLEADAEALQVAVSDLVRIYQFRDRNQICCHDISVTQCYALEALVEQGPLRLRALATRMYLDNSTTSRVVQTLVRKGYAASGPEAVDRRAVAISATRAGRRLYARIMADLVEQQKLIVQDIAPEVRAGVIDVIRRLSRAAETRFACGVSVGAGREHMDNVTDTVREKYGAAARRVARGESSACCGTAPSSACGCGGDPITSGLYETAETLGLPETAVAASLGCGNPTALAQLNAGEVVLDLGSGGGLDVLLSARRVGPSGKAYGVDTTDEMLALAEDNKRKSGITNAEFLRGTIENIPLPNGSVDVVISNCVINLSGDKQRVLHEAYRVLKPGGRFAVSDVVVRGPLPAPVQRSMELWVGCIAGALTEREYRDKLQAAGFTDVELEVTRTYDVEDARSFLASEGLDVDAVASEVKDKVVSAFIRARKPAACCGPTCCS